MMMTPVFVMLLIALSIAAGAPAAVDDVVVTTYDSSTTLRDVPSTRGFECPRSCFHFTDNIYIQTVDLWCRCPVEVIHMSREQLYQQPLATGSPPLLESEASESMKRHVRKFNFSRGKIYS